VVIVVAAQIGLLVPIVLTAAVLGGLPLLLIVVLALAAVYSQDPARRSAAEKILDRLLIALPPWERPTSAPRRGSAERRPRKDPG
jgi:hypothetical protein